MFIPFIDVNVGGYHQEFWYIGIVKEFRFAVSNFHCC